MCSFAVATYTPRGDNNIEAEKDISLRFVATHTPRGDNNFRPCSRLEVYLGVSQPTPRKGTITEEMIRLCYQQFVATYTPQGDNNYYSIHLIFGISQVATHTPQGDNNKSCKRLDDYQGVATYTPQGDICLRQVLNAECRMQNDVPTTQHSALRTQHYFLTPQGDNNNQVCTHDLSLYKSQPTPRKGTKNAPKKSVRFFFISEKSLPSRGYWEQGAGHLYFLLISTIPVAKSARIWYSIANSKNKGGSFFESLHHILAPAGQTQHLCI